MKNADVLFVNIQDLYIGLCLMEYLIEYYKDIFNRIIHDFLAWMLLVLLGCMGVFVTQWGFVIRNIINY